MSTDENNTTFMYDLVADAVNNTISDPKLKEMTLDAAWRNHGPESKNGSYIETGISQSGFEESLICLHWRQADLQDYTPNVIALTAKLPIWVKGYSAAVPATSLSPHTIVEINIDDPYHPAAIAEGEVMETDKITMIVERNASEDPDVAFAEINGPIVATWFPGEPTPPSTPDGVLKTGDRVTVKEAIKHGFNTVKFKR